MAASEIVVSVIYEPADWLLTYDDYKQNGFNPWMLLGFLPFIPGGAGRHADDVVDLYRAVGPDELADIEKTGILRVDLSGKNFSTGKWFATTSEDANKWGEAMSAWDNKGFSVIQVEAPKSILSKLDFVPKLDGIGPAYFAPANMLNFFKVIK